MNHNSGIFIGLGANLPGPDGRAPLETCQKALEALATKGVQTVAVSPVYESAPWPPSDQPWYLNAVAEVKTSRDPADLMQTLLGVEADLGRTRGKKNDARIIDLDIIDFKGKVLPNQEDWLEAPSGGLFLPHRRSHERVFVLKPLIDLAPDWVHPVYQLSGRGLLKALPQDGKIRLAKEGLQIP